MNAVQYVYRRGGELYGDYFAAENFGGGGHFATLGNPQAPNSLMRTLTGKSMLYSEGHDTRAVPSAGRASGGRRRSAPPGLRRGAPSSHPSSTRAGGRMDVPHSPQACAPAPAKPPKFH